MELTLKCTMVVDDCPSTRALLSIELKRMGVQEVLCFENGLTALQYLQDRPYQVDGVFTDLHMPEMDGLELLHKLGEMNYTGGVFIVSEMEERIVQLAVQIALSLHVHLLGSIEKPIDLERLSQAIFRLKQVRGAPIRPLALVKKRELIRLIEEDCILPYYQPKIDTRTKKVCGVEVLCRLYNPTQNEVVTPDRFIPVAHRYGLIDLLTEKLMFKCLKEIASIPDWGAPNNASGFISINLLPSQLFNGSLPSHYTNICDQIGFDQKRIIFEITERQVLSEPAQLMTLDRLRLQGFGVSLDDFGTGYTNIRQLRELPFTELKIDQCLIKHIFNDRISQVVLESLIRIATELRMSLVTEGIEDLQDYRYLERTHHVIAQGYLISRPKPLREFAHWMDAWNLEHADAANISQMR